MAITKKREFGNIGEELAKMFLVKHGMEILGANYSRPWGEIDIIAKDELGTIRFIEVKSSKYFSDSSFDPEIRVNKRKISRLKKICETYLSEIKASKDQEWQIDVISVILDEDNDVKEIRHIENAVFEKPY